MVKLLFHQYQQNNLHVPLLISNNWIQKKAMTYSIGNPGPALWQAKKGGGVKPLKSSYTCSVSGIFVTT